MQNIIALYQAVYQSLASIAAQATKQDAQKRRETEQAKSMQQQVRAEFAEKRRKLEEDLRTAESYVSQVLALVGGRVPQAAAQRPDFTRMRQLYVSIDSPSDPEAQQLLRLAAGAVKYLQNQREQLAGEESAALRQHQGSAKQDDSQTERAYIDLLGSPQMRQLAEAVRAQSAYAISRKATYDLPVPAENSERLFLGFLWQPFPVPKKLVHKAQTLFGNYYIEQMESVCIPYGIPTDQTFKLKLSVPDAERAGLQNAMCGLCFNILRSYRPLAGRVIYLDPATYNPEHLGAMQEFCGADRLITFPTTEEQIQRTLGELIDAAGQDGQTRFLIVRGYPDNFSGVARERIRRICNNSAQYHVCVILTQSEEAAKCTDTQDAAAMNGALEIGVQQQFFYLKEGEKKSWFFFFDAPGGISAQMAQRFAEAYRPKLLGNSYVDRIPLDPHWRRGAARQDITIPFGVDDSDQLCSLDFNGGTNMALYLMGATGSGKSVSLHTIITSLVRNYHPDDVELWLADFKMGEMAQYIDPMPPHVKYILLDESAELVYDFLELLTQEMMRRKEFFSVHPTLKKLENVPNDVYMPIIFVIIDEFSLMSQAINDSERYKQQLTNLLTEGRSLGFKFIFASQEYTTGVAGLSATARDQIQTRMAMKNTPNEIRDTLNLPTSAMTDAYRSWIDNLPPHVALYKHYDVVQGQATLTRIHPLYFPGDDYTPQRQMLKKMRQQMKPSDRYTPDDILTYVDKHPVVEDGRSLQVFSEQRLTQSRQAFCTAHPEEVFPEDVFLPLGKPRRMMDIRLVQLTDESRQNLLLLSGDETACAMSVIQSAARAFVAQQGSVQVWSWRREPLYRRYAASQLADYRCCDQVEDIAAEIAQLSQLVRTHRQTKQLVVLMGVDRILEGLQDMQEDARHSVGIDLQNLAVSTAEEQAAYDQVKDVQQALNEQLDRIEEEGEAAGKSEEEIEREINEAIARFMNRTPPVPVQPPKPAPAPVQQLDYLEELRYLVNRGSSCGIHFLLCVKDYHKLRESKLNPDWFRHRAAFCISKEDSSALFGGTRASRLPARIGFYRSDTDEYTFRPYLHPGITWDGWDVTSAGEAIRTEDIL